MFLSDLQKLILIFPLKIKNHMLLIGTDHDNDGMNIGKILKSKTNTLSARVHATGAQRDRRCCSNEKH